MYKQIILFFLILPFSVYSQSIGIVTYGQKILITENNRLTKNSEFASSYDKERMKMSKTSDKIMYKLQYNKSEASFSLEKSMSIDESENDLAYAIMHVRGDGLYYFSSKNNISLWDHDVFGKRIILTDTINPKDWLITKETKTIGKYKVLKAIKKKELGNGKFTDVIAWFAPEIPNNFGPLGYNGLPGLILEIHEKDFIIYAKKVQSKNKETKIIKPSKGTYMGSEEYQGYLKKAALDFISN